MAILAYPVEYDDVTKEQRDFGKIMELSCVFGTGGAGFRKAAQDKGIPMTLKEAKRIVKAYRDSHPKTVDAWTALETAAKKAIINGVESTILDGKIHVACKTYAQTKYLVITLPSGRGLYYPWPRIKQIKKKYTKAEMLEEAWKAKKKFYVTNEIQFYGTQKDSSIWGWVGTWGSRLFENCVQSIGADLLETGCVEAEKQGFDIVAVIHDQALALAKKGKTLGAFIKALCYKKPWAKTFPLEADGSVAPYYRKD
jgi:DNA polymerase